MNQVTTNKSFTMKRTIPLLLSMGLLLMMTSGMDCINAIHGDNSSNKNFVATFSGDAERPNPVITNATGNGTFTLNDDETELTYNITITGLSGDVTAAHFHFSADGANGSGPFMLPGGTDGTITQNVVNDGNGGATAQGTLAVNAQDVSNLRLNYLYVNFHTAQNQPGEVRGNIVPAN